MIKTETYQPILPATRCLVATSGAVLALTAFILNIGGFDFLSRIVPSLFVTKEGWLILCILVVAALVGCLMKRLKTWWLIFSGCLVGLFGAWGIMIYAVSQI
jgi:hypothetical protein